MGWPLAWEVLRTMKLGEMLVSAGKITSEELEETLKGQAIFGGRFGTNLVEMGFLEEGELAQFLSQKTGVPCASPEQLMDLSPQVIRLLPEDAVKKYRVIPVALNNRKLSLAMTDPSDYATIDEISFVTGYIVVPLITPELRLVCALEKHYNIRRDLRYIPVAGGGRGRSRATQATAPAFTPAPVQPPATPPRPSLPSEPEEIDIFELSPMDESDCFFGDMNEIQTQAPTPASLAAVSPNRIQAQAPALASLAAGGPNLTLASELEAATLAVGFLQPDYSLDGVLQGLAQAQDRHSIAELIVGYTARQFKRSALFLIKGDQAIGWAAQIGDQPLPGFDTLSISLAEPSVLKVVAESKTSYLGPAPLTPANSRMFAALGGEPTANQLLAPLIMTGRVVAILYVDGGTRRLDESIPELQKLLAKGAMAFEILILRSKILLT